VFASCFFLTFSAALLTEEDAHAEKRRFSALLKRQILAHTRRKVTRN